MARYNVEYGNTWAAYCTHAGDFITPFMPHAAYMKWWELERGRKRIAFEKARCMTFEEAVQAMRSTRGIVAVGRFAVREEKVAVLLEMALAGLQNRIYRTYGGMDNGR